MALKKLTIEIDSDLLLELKQFCFENRLNYSSAIAEIMYGFFDNSTLSQEFEMSDEYREDYVDDYGHVKKNPKY